MAAHSVNGEISLEGITGDYDVGTTNGGTAVSGCKGAGILRSVNGAIDMEDVRGSVDVENVNGAISYSGEMTGGGKNRIQTVNGAVGVKLVGSPSLTIDAASAVGGISSGLPGLTASGLVGKQMAGTLGDGEAELKIRTASGSITIE
jgi:DUF4097 and DUF4098 domain-containing protein YvlB